MNKYFSYDWVENEFDTHATLEEAKEWAESQLEQWRELASDDGWEDVKDSIFYGEIKGTCVETRREFKEDYTEEEWSEMTRCSNDCDEIVDYGMKDI